MTIRKIAQSTTSLAVSATTTQSGIFKTVAQQLSGIGRLENLSSLLVPKVADVSAKLIARLLYDTDGFGTRFQYDYIFVADPIRLNLSKPLADNTAIVDRILLNITSFREFFDGLSTNELIELLLFTTRTFDNSIDLISRPSKLVIKAPIYETQNVLDELRLIRGLPRVDSFSSTDNRNFWFNKVLTDTTPALDLLNVFDGLTYAWIMQRFEAITIGSPAAMRYAGNALENTSFWINKPRADLVNVGTPFISSGTTSGGVVGGSGNFNVGIVNRTWQIATSTAFTYGTGDFTVEWWSNQAASGGVQGIWRNSTGDAVFTSGFLTITQNSGRLTVTQGDGTSGNLTLTSNTTIALNTWHHYAYVKNNGVHKLYVDGAAQNNSFTWVTSVAQVGFMQVGNAGGQYSGYITNFRIVKGTAVYTSDFTPSTTPLTAIAGTQLLALFTTSGAVNVDSSPNNFTLVPTSGGPVWTSSTPFTAGSGGAELGFNRFSGDTLENFSYWFDKALRIDNIQAQEGIFNYLSKNAAADFVASTDVLNYNSYMQRFEFVTIGSPAATRYSGNALENTSFWINKTAKQSTLVQLGNLFTFSEQFDNAAWAKVNLSVTSNTTTAPNGTLSADTITSLADGNFGVNQTRTFENGVVYTVSGYVKYIDNPWFRLNINNVGGAWIDILNGTVGTVTSPATAANITPVGNGWYRITVQFTGQGANWFTGFSLSVANGSLTEPVNTSFFLWGAQLEAAATAGNYVPTTSAAIITYTNTAADRDRLLIGTQIAGNRVAGDTLENFRYQLNQAFRTDTTQSQEGISLWINKSAKLGLDRYSNEGNISPNSENVAGWSAYSSNLTLATDAATAPDGTATADIITFLGAGYRYTALSVGPHQGQTYTASAWIWSPNASKATIGFRLNDSSIGADQTFTSITLTTWPIRYSITRTFSSNNPSVDIGLDNRSSLGGDNTSGSVAVWGLQLQSGTVAGPYVRTTNTGIYIVNNTPNDTDRVRIGTYQSGNRTTFDGLENTSFWINKLITELLTAADRKFLYLSKPLTEQQQLQDSIAKLPNKGIRDVVITTDTTRDYIEKVNKDFLSMLDNLSVARIKYFFDAFTPSDFDRLFFNKSLADLVTADDPLVRLSDGLVYNSIIQKRHTVLPLDNFTRRINFIRRPHHGFLDTVSQTDPDVHYFNKIAKAGALSILPILRTNFISYSEQFNIDSYWNKTGITVSSNVIVAPSNVVISPSTTYDAGQLLELFYNQPLNAYANNWYQLVPGRWEASSDADLLLASTSNSTHNLTSVNILQLTPSENFAFAIYVKYAGQRYIRVNCTVDIWADFDLVTNSIAAQTASKASIQDVGNGWYLCEIANRVVSFGTAPELQILHQILLNSLNNSYGTDFIALVPESANQSVQISLLDDNRNASFQGSGTSGVIVWGAQLEIGAEVEQEISSLFYIRTTGTPASRTGFNVMPNDYDRIYVSDFLAKILLGDRTPADTVDLSETMVRNALYLRGVGSAGDQSGFTENLSLSDFVVRGLVFNRTFTEAITEPDRDFFDIGKSLRSNTLTVSDTIRNSLRINDFLFDTVLIGTTNTGIRLAGDTLENVRFLLAKRSADLTTESDTDSFFMNKTAKQGIDTFQQPGNIITWSENFTVAATSWTVRNGITAVSSTAALAPNGTLTANRITLSGVADPVIGQLFNISPSGKTITSSIWAWIDAGQPTGFQLFLFDNTVTQVFATAILTLTTTPTRYNLTATFPISSSTGFYVRYDPSDLPTTGNTVYVWGAQAEFSGIMGNYVPTTTTAITPYWNNTAASSDVVRAGEYATGIRTAGNVLENLSFLHQRSGVPFIDSLTATDADRLFMNKQLIGDGVSMIDAFSFGDNLTYTYLANEQDSFLVGNAVTGLRRSGDALERLSIIDLKDAKSGLTRAVSGTTVTAADRDRLFVGQQYRFDTRLSGDPLEQLSFLTLKAADAGVNYAVSGTTVTAADYDRLFVGQQYGNIRLSGDPLENTRFTLLRAGSPGLNDTASSGLVIYNVWPQPIDIFNFVSSAFLLSCTIARDPAQVLSPAGGIPLKMTVTGADPHIQSYSAPQWNLNSARPGQTWTFSVWARGSVATSGQLFIFGMDAAGSGVLEVPSQTVNIAQSSWTRVSGTFTFSNPNVRNIQVRLDGPESGPNGTVIWWDGLQVEAAAAPTGFQNRQRGFGGTAENLSILDLKSARAGVNYTIAGFRDAGTPNVTFTSVTVTAADIDRLIAFDDFQAAFASGRSIADFVTIGTDAGFRLIGSNLETTKFFMNKRFDDTTPALDFVGIFDGLTYTYLANEQDSFLVGNAVTGIRRSGDALENISFINLKTAKAGLTYAVSGTTVTASDRDRLFVGTQIVGTSRLSGDNLERISILDLKSIRAGANYTVSGITVTAADTDRLFVGQQYGNLRLSGDPLERTSFLILRAGSNSLSDTTPILDPEAYWINKVAKQGPGTQLIDGNLVTFSSDFANAGWGKSFVTVSSNVVASPVDAASIVADRILEDNNSGQHLIFQTTTPMPLTSVAYTISCWVKYDGVGPRRDFVITSFGENYVAFNTTSGAVISNGGYPAGSIAYPNGWFRCWTTIRKTNGTGDVYFGFWNTGAGNNLYAGTTGTLLIYGAQVTATPYLTNYVDTTGTVTRFFTNNSNDADRITIGTTTANSIRAAGDVLENFSFWKNKLIGDTATMLDAFSFGDNLLYTLLNTETDTVQAGNAVTGVRRSGDALENLTYTATMQATNPTGARYDATRVGQPNLRNSTWDADQVAEVLDYPSNTYYGRNWFQLAPYLSFLKLYGARTSGNALENTRFLLLKSNTDQFAVNDQILRFLNGVLIGPSVSNYLQDTSETIVVSDLIRQLLLKQPTTSSDTITAGLVPYNLWPYPTSLFTAVSATAVMYEGTSSLVGQTPLVVGSTSSTDVEFKTTIRVPVKPSTAYNFSVYVHPLEVFQRWLIAVTTYTITGTLIGGFTPGSVSSNVNTWTRVTASTTVASNAAFLAVEIRRSISTSAGAVIIDGLQITEGSTLRPLQTRLRGLGSSSESLSLSMIKRPFSREIVAGTSVSKQASLTVTDLFYDRSIESFEWFQLAPYAAQKGLIKQYEDINIVKNAGSLRMTNYVSDLGYFDADYVGVVRYIESWIPDGPIIYPAGLYKTTYAGYFADNVNFFTTATPTTFGANPAGSVQTTTISEPISDDGENFSVQWLGYFVPATTETYTFFTTSDDGSFVWVGPNALSGFTTGNAIVKNGGAHAPVETSGTISLTAGVYYPIRIQFGENTVGDVMEFSYSTPTITKTTSVTGRVFYNQATNGF